VATSGDFHLAIDTTMIPAMRRSRSGPLAQGVLAFVAVVLAHHAMYIVSGESTPASATSVPNADGYWQSIELVVAVAAAGLITTASRQLWRLRRQARRVRLGSDIVPESELRYLLRLFLRAWLRVTALATVLFVLQENIERWIFGAPLPGLNALAPPDCQLAFLLIVAGAAAVALVASLVRWRTLVLRARLRACSSGRPRASSVGSLRQPLDRRPVVRLLAAGLGMRAPPMGSAA
jgi:hypothetical protein